MEQESTNLDYVNTGSFDESDSSHDDFIVRSLDLNDAVSTTVVLKAHNPLHAPSVEMFPATSDISVSNEQLDKADVILDDYMKNLGEPVTSELLYKTILPVEEKPIITSGGPVSKATGFLDDYMREKNEG